MATSTAAEAKGILDLHARNIVFNDVVVTVTTPFGDLPIKIEGEMQDKGALYQATATIAGEAAFAKLSGKLGVIISKATRQMNLRLDISQGQLTVPDIEVLRLGGWAQAEVVPGHELPSINAQLGIGALKLFGVPMEGTTLNVSSGAEKSEAVLQGAVINNSGDVNIDFRADHTDKQNDRLTLRAETKLRNLYALDLVEMDGQGSLVIAASGEHAKGASWSDMAQWKNLNGSAGVDMEKLSLPGLLSGAEALGTVKFSLDPATQQVTFASLQDDLTFQGKLKAINNRLLHIRLPLNSVKPAALVWDHRMKTAKITLQGGELSALDFMAKRVDANVTAHLAGAPVLEGKLDIGELRHNAQTRYFVPVRASLQFVPMSSIKSGTGYTGAISEKNGWISAKLEGRHDSANAKGFLSINMPPTNFAVGAAQVAMAFPFMQNYFTDGFGTVGLAANVTWQKGKGGFNTTSSGQLYLKDFTCSIRDNVITGINTVMNLATLSPVTIQQQTVSVGGVNVGLPLTDGVAVVSLDPRRNFTVHSAEWAAVGGKISSGAFTMPLETMSTSVTLTARDLDLQQLFSIAPLEGLAAVGKVNGTIPLQISGGKFQIVNGTLQTTGPGTIKYNPQKPPAFLQNTTQQQIVDLKAALSQFNYDSLGVTINGELGQSQQVQLRIRGRNPLFYAGKAVNFNLNVDGPLENIIRYNPGGSRIPDAIRKQMENYEASHAKQ
ncbi:MAG TPA: YdbH domain-containing protein [Patescibacteria group bacterium]|nr:YdbH domain-containing protein [Patescibacteria group bacterium]